MRLIKILPLIFLLMLIPARSFADMPQIEAGNMYFDVFKGYYVLENNVHVVMNNHGVTATITANNAKVNVVSQKCWANGKVTFTYDKEFFSCDSAFLQWKTKTADIVGAVNFKSDKKLAVTADKAVFNWSDKIVDFYGDVKVTAEKKLKFASGLKLEQTNYDHVKYNVEENIILQLDKTFDVPAIDIPNPDGDDKE